MASTTGDGAERAEPRAAAPSPPRPPIQEATPAPGAGTPSAAADGGGSGAPDTGSAVAAAAPLAPGLPTGAGATPSSAQLPGPQAPDAPAAQAAAGEPSAKESAGPILAIPPVAVPKVRKGPASTRSIKGETTASDYVAPREIPAHTPRPSESVDAKVVIDVPDASAGSKGEAEVVEMRQRRRAPTMKIDRSKIGALKEIEGARERSTQPDLPALPNGGVLPTPHATSHDESLRPASVGIDAHRPLARPRPEPRSARGLGWAVVALATVVVGGGVAAIALGLVPGLGPTPPADAVAPAGPSPAEATSPPTATPEPTLEPAPSESATAPAVVPTVEASAAPAAASAPEVPTATSPTRPPLASPPGPPARPAQPYPRPRPKSDIPQGI